MPTLSPLLLSHLLLVRSAAAGPAPTAAPVEAVRFDDDPCIVGETVYVVTPSANFRAGPMKEAAALKALPLGAPLKVLTKHAATEVDGRSGAWCGLRDADGAVGAMFSPTLSAHRWQADLDEDGQSDSIFVSYNSQRHLLVQVRSPAGLTGLLDLGEQMDMGGPLDVAEVAIATGTGVPLLRVYVPGSEQCGGYSKEYYVSWRRGPDGQRAARLALSGATGGDAPVYSSTEFTFHPKKRQVSSVQTFGEALESGETAEDITTTTLRWDGVAYQEVSKVETHKGPPRSE
jgi:hypothetical protein